PPRPRPAWTGSGAPASPGPRRPPRSRPGSGAPRARGHPPAGPSRSSALEGELDGAVWLLRSRAGWARPELLSGSESPAGGESSREGGGLPAVEGGDPSSPIDGPSLGRLEPRRLSRERERSLSEPESSFLTGANPRTCTGAPMASES